MYTEDKVKAKEFLIDHYYDKVIRDTLEKIDNSAYMHSDRWSIVYDMLLDNYPEYRSLTTGIVYLVEDGELNNLT